MARLALFVGGVGLLAVAVAAFFVLGGDDGQDAVPPDRAPSPATSDAPAATDEAADDTVARADAIDEVALANMTVPGPNCLTDEAVTLVDGEAPAVRTDTSGFGTYYGIGGDDEFPRHVVLADLDGDGVQDGVAVVHCWFGANVVFSSVHALVGGASTAVPVAFGEGVSSPFELGVNGVQADGAELLVDYTAGEEDEPHCCPSIDVTDRFRWDGAGFERIDRRVTRMSDVAALLVKAVNGGDLAGAAELAAPEVVAHLASTLRSYGTLNSCEYGGTFADQGVRDCFIGTEAGWTISVIFEKRGAHEWFAVSSRDIGGGL